MEENWLTYNKREIQGIWYVIENEGTPTQRNIRVDDENDADIKLKKLIQENVMSRNDNPDLDGEKNKAKSLEDLLMDIDKREEAEIDREMSSELPEIEKPRLKMDFANVVEKADTEAKEILDSIISFYINNDPGKKEIIDELVASKQKIDELTLSSIIFALRTAQYAITKALEEIDLGNTNPRIFQSLASLQSQLMNMVKHQAAYSMTLQESYKQIKADDQILTPKKMKAISEGTNDPIKIEDIENSDIKGFKVRGQKDLIKSLKETQSEEVEFEEVDGGLVDAQKRPEAPEHAKEDETKEKNDFEIDEDHF